MISAMLSWVISYGGSARKARKVSFYDIEYDIITKIMNFYDIEYDIITKIMNIMNLGMISIAQERLSV
jgi:hypothetical protein